MAFIVFAVSIIDSPFLSEESEMSIFTTFAPKRLAAISNEVLVRVEFSKKKFTRIFPSRLSSFEFFLKKSSAAA